MEQEHASRKGGRSLDLLFQLGHDWQVWEIFTIAQVDLSLKKKNKKFRKNYQDSTFASAEMHSSRLIIVRMSLRASGRWEVQVERS